MPIFWLERRMVSQREKPFIPGSITSRMAALQSGACSSEVSASSALPASSTSIPLRRRFSAMTSRMLASSSTTSTFTIGFPPYKIYSERDSRYSWSISWTPGPNWACTSRLDTTPRRVQPDVRSAMLVTRTVK